MRMIWMILRVLTFELIFKLASLEIPLIQSSGEIQIPKLNTVQSKSRVRKMLLTVIRVEFVCLFNV
jgi:hypothetical protein